MMRIRMKENTVLGRYLNNLGGDVSGPNYSLCREFPFPW